FGMSYANAFFDGKHLVFGDGDGTNLLPTSAALDVVAHEFTHGVTTYTAKLGMEGENGALNEAISDIFGCFVEGGARPDWKMGETVFRKNGKAAPLRDLVDPHKSGNPADMSEFVQTQDDNGGVHLNSTIVSHAAYLMAKKVKLDALRTIWYRALSKYLTS